MKTFMDNTKSLSKKKENVQEQPVSDTATNLQQALSSDSSLIPVPFIFIKSTDESEADGSNRCLYTGTWV